MGVENWELCSSLYIRRYSQVKIGTYVRESHLVRALEKESGGHSFPFPHYSGVNGCEWEQ